MKFKPTEWLGIKLYAKRIEWMVFVLGLWLN